MKKWQFWVSVLLSLCSLAAVLCLILFGRGNQSLQIELQKQQEVISKGTFSQQVGNSLLRDMAAVAGKNANIKNILVMHGYAQGALEGPAAVTPSARGSSK